MSAKKACLQKVQGSLDLQSYVFHDGRKETGENLNF